MTNFRWLWLVVFSILFTQKVFALDTRSPYNSAILEIIKGMPSGGGYDTSSATFKLFKSAVALHEDRFVFSMENATPSFCSSSTYLVFLKLIAQMQQQKKLTLQSSVSQSLLISAQPDGSGVWGRWNANGPGTARLFYELSLGVNFVDISKAVPGDFMKAFWTDEIGAKERGHSVVFTGTRDGGEKICFWSSNSASATQPAGMGEKCLAKSKFRRMVFSRLQSLENLNQIPSKIAWGSRTYYDVYLADMLKRDSSPEEMCAQVGCESL